MLNIVPHKCPVPSPFRQDALWKQIQTEVRILLCRRSLERHTARIVRSIDVDVWCIAEHLIAPRLVVVSQWLPRKPFDSAMHPAKGEETA
mgnify:CR=1 FL=1